MNDHTQAVTLVLGATGKTGRRVLERLNNLGRPVRAGSRSGRPQFAWDAPESWASVLDGVSAAYIAFAPDLALPGAAQTIGAFVSAAVEHGVGKLVLLSGRGEEQAALGEQVVMESGVQWTVVRASWFAQNFSEHFLLDAVREGVVHFPAGDVLEPFVDAGDVAEVAVAALTDDRHAGRLYEVTGPRLLTFADAVDEISRATARTIRYVPVSVPEYAAVAAEVMPPDEATMLAELFGKVLDGRNAHTAEGVMQALGREATDFRDYALAAAATGVWSV